MVKNGTDDNQDRVPFRDQKTAMGHAAYSGLYPFSDFGHIRSLWINDF